MKIIFSIDLFTRILRYRFIKFGTVGFSGTLINILILYLNQEFFFRKVSPEMVRLYLSLIIAIFIATISNFLLNRWWTWGDRCGGTGYGFFIQMLQYFLGSGVSIVVQYILTLVLVGYLHYLFANVIAIMTAAIFTYLVNDVWTFALRKNMRRNEVSLNRL